MHTTEPAPSYQKESSLPPIVDCAGPPAGSTSSPVHHAEQSGVVGQPLTRDIWMDDGSSHLELRVAADADLEGRFRATCLYTGETLFVSGWLAQDWGALEPLRVVA